MRYPLWIVNNILLLLLLITVLFIFLARPKKVAWVPLQVAIVYDDHVTHDIQHVDITKIYENDLFNTYKGITAAAPIEPDYTVVFPEPPHAGEVIIPTIQSQPALPPLAVTLRGIMLMNDGSDDEVIIAENATNKEKNYKSGDLIEDAQIIRILPNKIIIMRSNGQQETLYLREKDIVIDSALAAEKNNWSEIIKKIDDNTYYIDPVEFVIAVPNLARFIDLCNLLTVYQKGQSIGCRAVNDHQGSLSTMLGLQSQDVIIFVNNISTILTEQRVEIYESLINLEINDNFTVTLKRDNEIKHITYVLKDLQDQLYITNNMNEKRQQIKMGIITEPSKNDIEKEQKLILESKYKFAPTEQEMRVRQRKNMIEQGKIDRQDDSMIPMS